ncbi:hypothetical protein QE152_g7702 [Popillia japonica]|uniref:Uncharacterized protein n=1 Tax=Popillia japonica TaxID=7064 RepID=A0AAW1MEB0_POPJA
MIRYASVQLKYIKDSPNSECVPTVGVWRKLRLESTEEIVNDLLHLTQDVSTFEGIMVNFQEILNQDKEDVTRDDLLQNFTAAADDFSEHTEITNLTFLETFSLIDKAMEIFTDHDIDESRSKNLMSAVAKDAKMKAKQ